MVSSCSRFDSNWRWYNGVAVLSFFSGHFWNFDGEIGGPWWAPEREIGNAVYITKTEMFQTQSRSAQQAEVHCRDPFFEQLGMSTVD